MNDGLAVAIPYGAPLPFLIAVFSQAHTRFYSSTSFYTQAGRVDAIQVGISALLVTLGCALPAILMITVKLLITESLHSRQQVRLRQPSSSPLAPGATLDAAGAAAQDGVAFWNQELEQLEERSSRIARHMRIYSFLATVVLSVCMVLLLTTLAPETRDAVRSVAMAAGAAAMVTFVLDIGRIVVRSARRDASVRMFASATQRFLLILTATVLLSMLALQGNIEWARGGGAMRWLLLGAGMAFLGDQAAAAVSNKVADFFKLPRPTAAPDDGLGRIEGMTVQNAQRLGEEGITNAHGLAFCSTPKLFLSTPYTLLELCDWQDQALLQVRLGPVRAAVCREQLMVRGATELMALGRDFMSGKLTKEKKDDLVKLLGLASEVQLHTLMHQAAADVVATRLVIFREAVPAVAGADKPGAQQ